MAPKILSFCCSSSASHPREPESWWAWLVCAAGTVAWALSFGIVNCFAVVMPVIIDQFKSSREATAWAGSIPSSLAFASIPICSKVVSRIGMRLGALAGTIMCLLSLVLTSFTTSLVHVFFSYSILFGVGCSMIFTSSVLAMTKYFNRRQGIALGMVTGGLNLGVLTLGPLMQLLISLYGFRVMYRIIASFFVVVLLLVLSYDPNVQPANEGDVHHKPKEIGFCKGLKELSKKPVYIIAVVSLLLQTISAFVTHVHLVNYCIEVGIPPSKSSNLFIAIGLSSLSSSIMAGRVIDIPSVNPLHVNQVGSLTMAVSMLLLPLATEYYHFIIYSVFLGLGSGVLVTTIVLLLLQTVEPRLRSVSFPFGQLVTSIGNLTGPPLIGFIADNIGSYKPAFLTAGGICLVGFFLPFLQYCFKPWRKPITNEELPLEPPSDHDQTEAVQLNGLSSRREPDSPLVSDCSETIPLNPLSNSDYSTERETGKPLPQFSEMAEVDIKEEEPLIQNHVEPESNPTEPEPDEEKTDESCDAETSQEKAELSLKKETDHLEAEPLVETSSIDLTS